MSDPTRRRATRPSAARAVRHAGILLAILLAVAGLSLFSGTAEASTRHSARRTVVRLVHASVTRSATVTAHATLRGHTVGITATAEATGRAAARATGHAKVTAATKSAAASRAHRLAAGRAEQRARRAATTRAAQRAIALATQAARARATTQAEQAAEVLATRDAGGSGQGSIAGTSDGTDPGGAGSTAGTGTGTGSVSAAACGGESVVKADGTPWTCTFDDEFDGTALDTGRWLVQQTANSGFNQGGACYTNSPDTVSVADGTLNLTVRRQDTPVTCPSPSGAFSTDYTAGEVTTMGTFSQTYGRYEVRAQLPASTVAGLQETFWLWPDTQLIYGPWPSSGEIDFAEFYSQYAGWVIPYLHYYYDTSTPNWATNTNIVTAWPAPYNQPGMNCRIDQAGYNTYTFTWQPNQLSIQVNGQNCLIDNYQASNLSGAAPFDQPFFLALTQALGVDTNAPTPLTALPATTHVDYVRVWK